MKSKPISILEVSKINWKFSLLCAFMGFTVGIFIGIILTTYWVLV